MSPSSTSVLVEPFDVYLWRRSRSALPLTPGEAVTATVGLLRGCRHATGRFEGAEWWLRADGCPVAVEEEKNQDVIAATADTLEGLASLTGEGATREIIVRARESVLTLPPREWEALERRLFQHADPVPLVLGPLTPTGDDPGTTDERAAPGAASRVLALVDADLADAARDVAGDLRARWRTSRAVRVGVLTAAAALIVVGGVLAWPRPGQPAVSAPEAPPTTVGAPPSVAASTVPSPPVALLAAAPPGFEGPASDDPPAVGDGTPQETVAPTAVGGTTVADPVEGARALFADVDRCAGEATCLAAFEEDSTSAREPLLPGAANGDVALIDDFGGVAVVRLTGAGTIQYVTIVRQKDRWLVRTVRTVADQPS
ncbi:MULTISPECIES: hypothetical protein [Microbacterium]|uniref:hypothetical protein n=1 Tax=Microbacterium TaxID=33882 RepID=UPI0027856EDC|nr:MULTISPECIES: hypothetical protein [Microbacterium]MDQ1084198.1 hypothetical protein [Microbacterium sp. SORGH_AS_0344]MDQ1170527.1 hypothetical protein [Microbacterium proteolyticum]